MPDFAPLPPSVDVAALPPFSPSLERMRSFYRLEFLPDGYPGRRDDDGMVTAHPLYGTYVIADYAKQLVSQPDDAIRNALRVVAHASVQRMEPVRDGIALFYEASSSPSSRQPKRHYSGLTQAYYAVALYRAFKVTGDRDLKEAAAAAFRSLLVPESDGGVLYTWPGGVALAEVPTSPRDLILNGWLSILVSIERYARLSGDAEARALVQDSTRTLAELLSLYDVPELRNTRYGLTGFVYLRLRFAKRPADLVISGMAMDLEREGTFSVPVEPATSRWQNWIVDPVRVPADVLDGRFQPVTSTLRLNVVLSRHSYPAPNRLTFVSEASRPMKIVLEANVGRYDPHVTAPVGRSWREADAVMVPAGTHRSSMALPWELVDLVTYPTNFVKQIEGHPTNVYHMIHIKRLRELAAITQVSALNEWADRWEQYVLDWEHMPIYAGLHVRHYFSDIGAGSIDVPTFRRRLMSEAT